MFRAAPQQQVYMPAQQAAYMSGLAMPAPLAPYQVPASWHPPTHSNVLPPLSTRNLLSPICRPGCFSGFHLTRMAHPWVAGGDRLFSGSQPSQPRVCAAGSSLALFLVQYSLALLQCLFECGRVFMPLPARPRNAARSALHRHSIDASEKTPHCHTPVTGTACAGAGAARRRHDLVRPCPKRG